MIARTQYARTQYWYCIISAALFSVLFSLGFLILSGFFPPPSPSLSAMEVAEFYRTNNLSIKIGMSLAFTGACCTLPLVVAISTVMNKADQDGWFLTATQAVSGTVALFLFILPYFFWLLAAFRPDRNPEITQIFNDIGWIMLTTPVAPFMIQLSCICLCALKDKRPRPFLPRWASYLGLWVAIGAVPGIFIPLYHDGPFAWNGLLSFWLPLGVIVFWGGLLTLHFLGLGFKRDSAKSSFNNLREA